MSKLFSCAYCNGQLEPAQQLRFLVEADSLDNPAFLACIRRMPSVNGKPVPVCSACQTKIEELRLERAANGVKKTPRPVAKAPISLAVGLLGVLSVGVLLGAMLNSRG